MKPVFNTLPKYIGGKASPYIYNVGCGMEDDLSGPTDKDCYALLISQTNAREYREYISALTEQDYKTIFENQIADNLYTQLVGNETMLYVYYTASKGEVRIISDPCSVPIDKFGYTCSAEGAEIYQYALHYDPNNGHSPTTTNCGMLFIVRLADNSLYMYDSGDLMQCSDKALEGMISFMHRITNTASCERIRIAAWHFSHAHNDHFAACAKMINRHHDELIIERLIFNFPSSSVRRPDSQTGKLKEILNKYCSDAMFLKLHSGQKFSLANAEFEVLYTHEDALKADDPSAFPLRDYNCTSSILKMTMDSGSVMWLGDTNTEAEAIIADVFPEQIWRSDVVQVAHHCFNYLSCLYPMIKAPYAMLPNSYFGGHTPENLPKLEQVICHLSSPESISYSDTTSGFRFVDGKYVKFLEEPSTGTEYDFSGY